MLAPTEKDMGGHSGQCREEHQAYGDPETTRNLTLGAQGQWIVLLQVFHNTEAIDPPKHQIGMVQNGDGVVEIWAVIAGQYPINA